MGKYYNGKLKSTEKTESLHFSLHSNYSCLHVRVTEIVMCPSPQLHQSSLVLQNSNSEMQLRQSTMLGRGFSELLSPYRTHGNHVSQKFCLFSMKYFLSFRTLLYQFSDFISDIKCLSSMEHFFFYCIPDSKIM